MPGPIQAHRDRNGDAILTLRDTGQQANFGPITDDEIDAISEEQILLRVESALEDGGSDAVH